MKILNVVKGMGRGGIETWLMQNLRKIDRERFEIDFLVHVTHPEAYDEEIESLGSRILRVQPENFGPAYWRYLRRFRETLEREGPYDVVHAHGGTSYGPLLREAARAGVPMRIIHGHNLQREKKRGLLRWPVRRFYRSTTDKYATAGLGCSRDACAALFGPDWEKDPRYDVLYYGIDLDPYRTRDRAGVRRELGLAEDDHVIVHVGRFMDVKNHEFIVAIAAEMMQNLGNARFVLVGDGPRRQEIEALIAQHGLTDRFVLTGRRADVPRVLSGMDAFVLPSHHEGLGLVLVEAQAAGLPCLVSSTVPRDVGIVPGMCHWLALAEGAKAWSEKLVTVIRGGPVDKADALATVEASPFNVKQSVETLTSMYEKALSAGSPA